MDRYYFNPVPGSVYRALNGNQYLCLATDGNYGAKLQNMDKYKWTFIAWGCQQYTDGRIEWDGSKGGYFAGEQV